VHPFSTTRPPVEGCQRGVRRAFIHEHEVFGVDCMDHLPPGSSQELVAFCRTQSPFFRLKPMRLRAREMVDWLTCTPATFLRYSHLSKSLAQGRSSTSASNSLFALSESFGRLPGAFPAESERPS
jgi:hypothetical protein